MGNNKNNYQMNMDLLYIGTLAMIVMAVCIIILVVYSSRAVTDLKKLLHERDEIYINRIEGLEAILRTEFKAVIQSLKK